MRKQIASRLFSLSSLRRHVRKWLRMSRQLIPVKGKKEIPMNMVNFKQWSRASSLALAGASLALLAACGGGGSVEPQATPTQPPSSGGGTTTEKPLVVINKAEGCGIAVGADQCPGTVVYTASGVVNATLIVDGVAAPISLNQGSNITVTVPLIAEGTKSLVIKNGDGTVLANASLAGSCVPDTKWDSEQAGCRAIAYYDEATVAIWGKLSVPYLVTLTGATPAKNMTRWNQETVTVIYCGLRRANNPDEFGRIHVACTSYPDGKEHRLYIDVPTGELREVNTKLAPNEVGYVFAKYDDYKYTEVYDPNAPFPVFGTRAYSKLHKGWFLGNDYTVQTAALFGIFFVSDEGVRKTVAEGTFETDGSVKLLGTFANPRP